MTGGQGPTDEGDAKTAAQPEKTDKGKGKDSGGPPPPAPTTGGQGPTDEGDA